MFKLGVMKIMKCPIFRVVLMDTLSSRKLILELVLELKVLNIFKYIYYNSNVFVHPGLCKPCSGLVGVWTRIDLCSYRFTYYHIINHFAKLNRCQMTPKLYIMQLQITTCNSVERKVRVLLYFGCFLM